MLQSETPALSSEDMAAIRRVSEEFARLMVAGDFNAIAQLYAEDAVLMPPHHPAVRGRKGIREWMTGLPPVSRFKLDIEQIEARADLAYVRGAFLMVLQPEGAPGPVEEVGKSVEIRKRQPDGSWPMIVDIFNSDK